MIVKIYSTAICPYCERAKMLLEKRNIKYTEFKIDEDVKLFEEKFRIPFVKRSSIFERIRNSLDYRIGIRNILKMNKIKNNSYNFIKSEGWKIDWFSNTQWQK